MLDNLHVELILLDIYMPGQLGLELLATIRSKGKDVDVIVISAASDIDSIQTALHFGTVDYLIKPFEFDRFQASLKKYEKNQQLLGRQKALKQAEVDQLFKREPHRVDLADIPKGLTKPTLGKIVKIILSKGNHYFTTEELDAEAGISRVSMGKYLHFLTEIEFLDIEINYGTMGRPANIYGLRKENEDVIYRFIGKE